MIVGYWKMNGKVPIGKEESRTLYEEPPEGDYCAVFETGSVVIVDIDDRDHKTESLEDPIHGRARSEAVIKFLDFYGYKYNGIRTENGVHLEFRYPTAFVIEKNKNNWYCAIGVRIEVKVTKPTELVRVNGVERQCFKGSIGDPDIDELPPALYPIQKSRDKPFCMEFLTGDRNNSLSSYALHLPKQGISAEDAEQIIRGINEFILEDPLDQEELDLILREETMEKMRNNERSRADEKLSHVQIGTEIMQDFGIVTVQGQMYRYREGVYRPVDQDYLGSAIRKRHPFVKTSMKNEALDFVADMTLHEATDEVMDLINVRNGMLKISGDRVELLPHSTEYISFKQFHADYDPAAKSEILDETLFKFFDGDQDLMKLFGQMLGYLLMNHTLYQKCFFFVGSPSSGKSKILNMVTEFCGRENVSNLSLAELDDRFRSANLISKIANINADLEKTRISSSGKFKSLVTGDSVTMEPKFVKPFSYLSTTKLIYACNQPPDFSKDPEGIFRRIILIPCNHVFNKTDPDFDPNIDERLQSPEALSALLNKAIEGYMSLVSCKGFITTSATEIASEDFRGTLNNVYLWMKECERNEEYLLREPIKDDLGGSYRDYCAFCFNAGEEAKPQQEFSRTICGEFGFKTEVRRVPHSSKRNRYFKRK